MSLHPVVALAGLLAAFSFPAIALHRRRTASTEFDWPAIRRGIARPVAILAVVVALVALYGTPADLGLRVPPVGRLVDGLLFGFVAFAGTMLAVGVLVQRAGWSAANPASLAVVEQPASRRLLVTVVEATVESLLFYGFVVEALLGLGAGPWLAGAGAVAGVLLARARWGVRTVLQWLPGSVVLAAVVLWTRSALVVLAVTLVYGVVVTLSADPADYRAAADAE